LIALLANLVWNLRSKNARSVSRFRNRPAGTNNRLNVAISATQDDCDGSSSRGEGARKDGSQRSCAARLDHQFQVGNGEADCLQK
jgi:hypothetical protein